MVLVYVTVDPNEPPAIFADNPFADKSFHQELLRTLVKSNPGYEDESALSKNKLGVRDNVVVVVDAGGVVVVLVVVVVVEVVVLVVVVGAGTGPRVFE